LIAYDTWQHISEITDAHIIKLISRSANADYKPFYWRLVLTDSLLLLLLHDDDLLSVKHHRQDTYRAIGSTCFGQSILPFIIFS